MADAGSTEPVARNKQESVEPHVPIVLHDSDGPKGCSAEPARHFLMIAACCNRIVFLIQKREWDIQPPIRGTNHSVQRGLSLGYGQLNFCQHD